MRGIGITGLLLAMALTGCIGDDDPPPPPNGFLFAGTGCEESLVFFQADPGAARAIVPEDLSLLGEPLGMATAFAALKSCETRTLDDAEAAPGMISDVGILLDGTTPDHFLYYQVWMGTDDEPMHAAHAAHGVPSFLAETTYSGASIVNIYTGTGHVPWAEGTYQVRVDGEVLPLPNAFAATGYHDTEFGRWVVEKVFTVSAQGGVQGRIAAEEGGPLTELMGGTSIDGVGLVTRYDYTARSSYRA